VLSHEHYFELSMPGIYYREVNGYAGPRWRLELRWGLLAYAIALALAAWQVRRMVSIFRWSLKRRGHCTKCNYDLRASLERCPECGTPIPKAYRGD
jgi:hypothetical protein